MTIPSDRRTRKRLATRQAISDAATRLFFERGFDRVTVDEIAEAADFGRMTVFNHFPRKEDMFFDQDQEARAVVLDAVRSRPPGLAPIEALRLLAHRLVAEESSFLRFFEGSRRFVETVAASEALKARARAIRDEVARSLTAELAASVGRAVDDPGAHLAAGLLLSTWTVAFVEAHEAFRRDGIYLATRALLAAPKADKHDDAPRKPPERYTGSPATIADLRRSGLVALTVTCDGPNCWNSRRVAFDDLGLHETTPVPEIPRWRGFRCQRCGSRRVRVLPDWTDHRARGNGRPPP